MRETQDATCRILISGMLMHVLTLVSGYAVGDDVLSLAEAESLALNQDPSVAAIRSRQSAIDELQVAAGQLPDPMLKFGVVSLPTDTFELGQEAMTQVQVGVVQTFPRGDTRALRAEQLGKRAQSLGEAKRDVGLRIRLSVREEYLEVLKQEHLTVINHAAESEFRDLEEITQDYYATGRVQQQDVLRAAVELAKVQERAARISEKAGRARARLATWIGDAAWRPLDPHWPILAEPAPATGIKAALADHPRLLALHQEVLAAEKGVELAQQNYKPEFALDLSYGGRGGTNPDGSSRADLLSFMVRMDLPLFHDKRQDRLAAASIAESAAVAFDRDDAHRRMRSEVDLHARTLEHQHKRIDLFEDQLLPEAEFNAEATFDAYQAAVEDLTTLMRARITEFDLRLEYVRLQVEALKTRARLLYLEGNPS